MPVGRHSWKVRRGTLIQRRADFGRMNTFDVPYKDVSKVCTDNTGICPNFSLPHFQDCRIEGNCFRLKVSWKSSDKRPSSEHPEIP